MTGKPRTSRVEPAVMFGCGLALICASGYAYGWWLNVAGLVPARFVELWGFGEWED